MPNNVTVLAFMSLDLSKCEDEELKKDQFKFLLTKKLLATVNPHKTDPGEDWYEMNVKRWGVKWDAYEQKIYSPPGDGSPHIFTFCTAWNPPNIATMRLLQKFIIDNSPVKQILWQWHNPYDNSLHNLKV